MIPFFYVCLFVCLLESSPLPELVLGYWITRRFQIINMTHSINK